MISVADYRKQNAEEHELQANLIEYLRLKGRKDIYAFAIPNAGKRSPRMGRRLKKEGMRAGVADVCIMMLGGRVIWVELKTEKGRASAAQKSFRAICAALDHPYLMPRTLEQAITVLKQLGSDTMKQSHEEFIELEFRRIQAKATQVIKTCSSMTYPDAIVSCAITIGFCMAQMRPEHRERIRKMAISMIDIG